MVTGFPFPRLGEFILIPDAKAGHCKRANGQGWPNVVLLRIYRVCAYLLLKALSKVALPSKVALLTAGVRSPSEKNVSYTD